MADPRVCPNLLKSHQTRTPSPAIFSRALGAISCGRGRDSAGGRGRSGVIAQHYADLVPRRSAVNDHATKFGSSDLSSRLQSSSRILDPIALCGDSRVGRYHNGFGADARKAAAGDRAAALQRVDDRAWVRPFSRSEILARPCLAAPRATDSAVPSDLRAIGLRHHTPVQSTG